MIIINQLLRWKRTTVRWKRSDARMKLYAGRSSILSIFKPLGSRLYECIIYSNVK